MFIAGLRKVDRVRGEGWLDCPNCHEHAAQDVVDEMRFAALTFYRFTPTSRSRVLRCRRCGHRREASAEELAALRTAGRRVSRAWLFPVGLTPFFAVLLAVGVVALRNSTAASSGPSYTTVSAEPVAPVSLEIPPGYNHSFIKPESTSSPGLYVASSGTFTMRLRRYPGASTTANTLKNHFKDDVGILTNGFPDSPPSPTPFTIAGVQGLRSTLTYLQQGAKATLDLYAFNHGGVSYMLSFLYVGAQGQGEADANLQHIVGSLKFTGDETPFPGTPSPSPSATAKPAATPSPTPTH